MDPEYVTVEKKEGYWKVTVGGFSNTQGTYPDSKEGKVKAIEEAKKFKVDYIEPKE